MNALYSSPDILRVMYACSTDPYKESSLITAIEGEYHGNLTGQDVVASALRYANWLKLDDWIILKAKVGQENYTGLAPGGMAA
jgi:hypothetical protein